MNAAEIHLALNHLPVLGAPFAAALLASGAWRKSDELVAAGLWTLVLCGLSAVAAYFSGAKAADLLLELPDPATKQIGAHIHAARLTLYGSLACAALALGCLLARLSSRTKAMVALCAALALTAQAGLTAHLGGEICHSEIR